MNEKIRSLLEKYRDELTKMRVAASRVEDQVGFPGVKGLEDESKQLSHIQWMIYTMLEDAEPQAWSDRKLNRWLGFIQGVLWCTKLRGILEMRDESRNLYD